MSLQTDNLVMIGRGVSGPPVPVPQGQPTLATGIHLRYAFARQQGFPWYGYYLFRRLHVVSKPTCVYPPDKLDDPASGEWTSPQGTFQCPGGVLVLDNAFAPSTHCEFDLRGGRTLDFLLPAGQTAREFRVTIGFYGDGKTGGTGGETQASGCLVAPFLALRNLFRRPPPPVGPIHIVASNGTSDMAHADLSGAAGAIATAVLTGDALDRVRIETGAVASGSCAVIEICYVPTLTDAGAGWERLADFVYPMSLPNAQPAYPCAGRPATVSAALDLAKSRVRYGPLAIWDDGRFDELTLLLDGLLAGGPSGGAMAGRTLNNVAATGGGTDDPVMPSISPLDLITFGSLNPAVAQALGLYWVDGTAAAGVAYDYAVLADHGNRFGGSRAAALQQLRTGALPADVDGYIVFNLATGTPPSLAPPADPRCYVLPGSVADPDSTPPGNNTSGLSWTIPAEDDGLMPGGAIFYHIWRADLGGNAPTSEPQASTLLTADSPILVVDAPIPAGVQPETAGDWPPFRLNCYDRHLPDGWYSYRVTGVDIFGQFSIPSSPAPWYQWQPMPQPRPWYYTGASPGSDAVVNIWALNLRDTTPPPPPAGVEAYVLDPDDPLLVKDSLYDTWWNAHWWTNFTHQAERISVRVTWKWTPQQQVQAPDTQEFRIYFSPGSAPPLPDGRIPANWQARIFTVPYANSIGSDGDGNRLYDILLPLNSGFGGVPLAPDNAHAVVYGQIGVSAADDKTATADDPQWQTPQPWQPSALGNRTGNEGRTGVPATIYRVLRTPPPPPPLYDLSGRAWATPADYHSLSYYTLRWPSPVGADHDLVDAHIYRALDESLFDFDFAQRPRQPLSLSQLPGFPAQWDFNAVKQELDALNAPPPNPDNLPDLLPLALPAYRGLSDIAVRVLASLPAEPGKPGNDGAFTQVTYTPLKHSDAANFDRIGPDNALTYVPDSALSAWQAELDGRARNRYFFRVAFVNAAHDVGPMGWSSPPVCLQDVHPSAPPHAFRIAGGDRRINLTWRRPAEATVARIQVYRTDDPRAATDIRLFGAPVADLPATVLTVQGGNIDLGAATSMTGVERIWKADGLLPGEDPITGGSATQYLATPVTGTNSVIPTSAPEGTEVVVVYHDGRNVLQYTPLATRPQGWSDDPVAAEKMTWYALVAVKQVISARGNVAIASAATEAAAAKAYDDSPPQPSVWVSQAWVRLDDAQPANELPFASTVTPSTPAVKLTWSNTATGLEVRVQRRGPDIRIWRDVMVWTPDATAVYDTGADPAQDCDYRITVRKANGQTADTAFFTLVHVE